MKTELMVILEKRKLEQEDGRLKKIVENLPEVTDKDGNLVLDHATVLALQTAIAINSHKLKLIMWVLDEEAIKTNL